MNDIALCRRFYAEELRAVAHLRCEALVRAFATVRREDFLGQGPWQVLISWEAGSFSYRTTEDSDPQHLYHNVLVAIDAARGLNNGHPSGLAGWFEQLICARATMSYTWGAVRGITPLFSRKLSAWTVV